MVSINDVTPQSSSNTSSQSPMSAPLASNTDEPILESAKK
jgi:hypothetical protein